MCSGYFYLCPPHFSLSASKRLIVNPPPRWSAGLRAGWPRGVPAARRAWCIRCVQFMRSLRRQGRRRSMSRLRVPAWRSVARAASTATRSCGGRGAAAPADSRHGGIAHCAAAGQRGERRLDLLELRLQTVAVRFRLGNVLRLLVRKRRRDRRAGTVSVESRSWPTRRCKVMNRQQK